MPRPSASHAIAVQGRSFLSVHPRNAPPPSELHALGFAHTVVLLSVLLEALALALAGRACGGALVYAVFTGLRTTAYNQFSAAAFRFAVTPHLIAVGLVYALILGLIGGLLLAIRAAPRVRLRTPRRSPPRPCRCRCTSSPCRSPASAGGACRAPESRCESLRSPPADGRAQWRHRAD